MVRKFKLKMSSVSFNTRLMSFFIFHSYLSLTPKYVSFYNEISFVIVKENVLRTPSLKYFLLDNQIWLCLFVVQSFSSIKMRIELGSRNNEDPFVIKTWYISCFVSHD